MSDKRIQRKRIETEIKRLKNMLVYSKCDDDDKAFINKNIKALENELGIIS